MIAMDEMVPSGVELRHLRYFATLAAAGSFTRAAELLFVAQPTLSQQIRRLESLVGTQLLQRRPEGVRLTSAGAVFLEVSRDVLSRMDHGMNRTREAAGLGRLRVRVAVPSRLPDALAVAAVSALRDAAAAADAEVAWTDLPMDAEFSAIRQRRTDAGIGWLTADPAALATPLEAMSLGDFEPDAWIPAAHAAARQGAISLSDLARMRVIHGPHDGGSAVYDAWTTALRRVAPGFAFTDPPFWHSLPVALALTASASRPTAVLTGPTVTAGRAGPRAELDTLTGPGRRAMTRVSLRERPLTATAALVWNGDLPRRLQQVLFDAADATTLTGPASPGDPADPLGARSAGSERLCCVD